MAVVRALEWLEGDVLGGEEESTGERRLRRGGGGEPLPEMQ